MGSFYLYEQPILVNLKRKPLSALGTKALCTAKAVSKVCFPVLTALYVVNAMAHDMFNKVKGRDRSFSAWGIRTRALAWVVTSIST
jgi:hypothetical protein